MKPASSKFKSLKNLRLYSSDDRAPCYYAEVEKDEKGKNCKWKIGCKYNGSKNECIIRMSKFGDIENEAVRSKINSVEFAIKLVDLFRDNGEEGVRMWINDGCL